MSKAVRWILALIVIAAAIGGGYLLGHRAASSSATESDAGEGATTRPAQAEPVAYVVTVPIRRALIQSELAAFGSVVAQPGEMKVISVPFESRVRRMVATQGQPVEKGAILVEIESSPDTQLALRSAQNDVEAAAANLSQTQERFNRHLATNTELSQARQMARGAQLKLESLTARGVGPATSLRAEFAGVVGKVDAQEGQIVAAGGPLVEMIIANRIEVKLGVEPDDAPLLTLGQAVSLASVDDTATKSVAGKIRLIGQAVDPATRLVDVFVSLPADSTLMLNTFLSGRITRKAAEGLIAPRTALLSNGEGGYALFTVRDGKAVKHSVRVGLQNDREVELLGSDLQEGDPVAIVGNDELDDGMRVQATPAPATEPTTAPSTDTAPSSRLPQSDAGVFVLAGGRR